MASGSHLVPFCSGYVYHPPPPLYTVLSVIILTMSGRSFFGRSSVVSRSFFSRKSVVPRSVKKTAHVTFVTSWYNCITLTRCESFHRELRTEISEAVMVYSNYFIRRYNRYEVLFGPVNQAMLNCVNIYDW